METDTGQLPSGSSISHLGSELLSRRTEALLSVSSQAKTSDLKRFFSTRRRRLIFSAIGVFLLGSIAAFWVAFPPSDAWFTARAISTLVVLVLTLALQFVAVYYGRYRFRHLLDLLVVLVYLTAVGWILIWSLAAGERIDERSLMLVTCYAMMFPLAFTLRHEMTLLLAFGTAALMVASIFVGGGLDSAGVRVELVCAALLSVLHTLLNFVPSVSLDRLRDQHSLTLQRLATESQAQHVLLRRCIPSVFVDQLLGMGSTKAAAPHPTEDVTVIFTEVLAGYRVNSNNSNGSSIVYRKLGQNMRLETLKILAQAFRLLDRACARCGAVKVETIGSEHVSVLGLPERLPGHPNSAYAALLTALTMLREVSLDMAPGSGALWRMVREASEGSSEGSEALVDITLQIGINSGPVVEAILGKKLLPRWKLFGDTVNTASRCKANGAPGRITLSRPARQLLMRDAAWVVTRARYGASAVVAAAAAGYNSPHVSASAGTGSAIRGTNSGSEIGTAASWWPTTFDSDVAAAFAPPPFLVGRFRGPSGDALPTTPSTIATTTTTATQQPQNYQHYLSSNPNTVGRNASSAATMPATAPATGAAGGTPLPELPSTSAPAIASDGDFLPLTDNDILFARSVGILLRPRQPIVMKGKGPVCTYFVEVCSTNAGAANANAATNNAATGDAEAGYGGPVPPEAVGLSPSSLAWLRKHDSTDAKDDHSRLMAVVKMSRHRPRRWSGKGFFPRMGATASLLALNHIKGYAATAASASAVSAHGTSGEAGSNSGAATLASASARLRGLSSPGGINAATGLPLQSPTSGTSASSALSPAGAGFEASDPGSASRPASLASVLPASVIAALTNSSRLGEPASVSQRRILSSPSAGNATNAPAAVRDAHSPPPPPSPVLKPKSPPIRPGASNAPSPLSSNSVAASPLKGSGFPGLRKSMTADGATMSGATARLKLATDEGEGEGEGSPSEPQEGGDFAGVLVTSNDSQRQGSSASATGQSGFAGGSRRTGQRPSFAKVARASLTHQMAAFGLRRRDDGAKSQSRSRSSSISTSAVDAAAGQADPQRSASGVANRAGLVEGLSDEALGGGEYLHAADHAYDAAGDDDGDAVQVHGDVPVAGPQGQGLSSKGRGTSDAAARARKHFRQSSNAVLFQLLARELEEAQAGLNSSNADSSGLAFEGEGGGGPSSALALPRELSRTAGGNLPNSGAVGRDQSGGSEYEGGGEGGSFLLTRGGAFLHSNLIGEDSTVENTSSSSSSGGGGGILGGRAKRFSAALAGMTASQRRKTAFRKSYTDPTGGASAEFSPATSPPLHTTVSFLSTGGSNSSGGASGFFSPLSSAGESGPSPAKRVGAFFRGGAAAAGSFLGASRFRLNRPQSSAASQEDEFSPSAGGARGSVVSPSEPSSTALSPSSTSSTSSAFASSPHKRASAAGDAHPPHLAISTPAAAASAHADANATALEAAPGQSEQLSPIAEEDASAFATTTAGTLATAAYALPLYGAPLHHQVSVASDMRGLSDASSGTNVGHANESRISSAIATGDYAIGLATNTRSGVPSGDQAETYDTLRQPSGHGDDADADADDDDDALLQQVDPNLLFTILKPFSGEGTLGELLAPDDAEDDDDGEAGGSLERYRSRPSRPGSRANSATSSSSSSGSGSRPDSRARRMALAVVSPSDDKLAAGDPVSRSTSAQEADSQQAAAQELASGIAATYTSDDARAGTAHTLLSASRNASASSAATATTSATVISSKAARPAKQDFASLVIANAAVLASTKRMMSLQSQQRRLSSSGAISTSEGAATTATNGNGASAEASTPWLAPVDAGNGRKASFDDGRRISSDDAIGAATASADAFFLLAAAAEGGDTTLLRKVAKAVKSTSTAQKRASDGALALARSAVPQMLPMFSPVSYEATVEPPSAPAAAAVAVAAVAAGDDAAAGDPTSRTGRPVESVNSTPSSRAGGDPADNCLTARGAGGEIVPLGDVPEAAEPEKTTALHGNSDSISAVSSPSRLGRAIAGHGGSRNLLSKVRSLGNADSGAGSASQADQQLVTTSKRDAISIVVTGDNASPGTQTGSALTTAAPQNVSNKSASAAAPIRSGDKQALGSSPNPAGGGSTMSFLGVVAAASSAEKFRQLRLAAANGGVGMGAGPHAGGAGVAAKRSVSRADVGAATTALREGVLTPELDPFSLTFVRKHAPLELLFEVENAKKYGGRTSAADEQKAAAARGAVLGSGGSGKLSDEDDEFDRPSSSGRTGFVLGVLVTFAFLVGCMLLLPAAASGPLVICGLLSACLSFALGVFALVLPWIEAAENRSHARRVVRCVRFGESALLWLWFLVRCLGFALGFCCVFVCCFVRNLRRDRLQQQQQQQHYPQPDAADQVAGRARSASPPLSQSRHQTPLLLASPALQSVGRHGGFSPALASPDGFVPAGASARTLASSNSNSNSNISSTSLVAAAAMEAAAREEEEASRLILVRLRSLVIFSHLLLAQLCIALSTVAVGPGVSTLPSIQQWSWEWGQWDARTSGGTSTSSPVSERLGGGDGSGAGGTSSWALSDSYLPWWPFLSYLTSASIVTSWFCGVYLMGLLFAKARWLLLSGFVAVTASLAVVRAGDWITAIVWTAGFLGVGSWHAAFVERRVRASFIDRQLVVEQQERTRSMLGAMLPMPIVEQMLRKERKATSARRKSLLLVGGSGDNASSNAATRSKSSKSAGTASALDAAAQGVGSSASGSAAAALKNGERQPKLRSHSSGVTEADEGLGGGGYAAPDLGGDDEPTPAGNGNTAAVAVAALAGPSGDGVALGAVAIPATRQASSGSTAGKRFASAAKAIAATRVSSKGALNVADAPAAPTSPSSDGPTSPTPSNGKTPEDPAKADEEDAPDEDQLARAALLQGSDFWRGLRGELALLAELAGLSKYAWVRRYMCCCLFDEPASPWRRCWAAVASTFGCRKPRSRNRSMPRRQGPFDSSERCGFLSSLGSLWPCKSKRSTAVHPVAAPSHRISSLSALPSALRQQSDTAHRSNAGAGSMILVGSVPTAFSADSNNTIAAPGKEGGSGAPAYPVGSPSTMTAEGLFLHSGQPGASASAAETSKIGDARPSGGAESVGMPSFRQFSDGPVAMARQVTDLPFAMLTSTATAGTAEVYGGAAAAAKPAEGSSLSPVPAVSLPRGASVMPFPTSAGQHQSSAAEATAALTNATTTNTAATSQLYNNYPATMMMLAQQQQQQQKQQLEAPSSPSSLAASGSNGGLSAAAGMIDYRQPATYDVGLLQLDLVGFTAMSAAVGPSRLLELLERLFASFDRLVAKRGALKVAVVGDAIIVATGVPYRLPLHISSRLIAKLGVDMIKTVDAFNAAVGPVKLKGHKLRARVGIHCGPVLAGVMGDRMPSFQLFGPNIDLAQTMESSGEPSQVHASAEILRQLEMELADGTRAAPDIKVLKRLPNGTAFIGRDRSAALQSGVAW